MKFVQQICAWTEDKRQFTPSQIFLAVGALASPGWVEKPATRSHA